MEKQKMLKHFARPIEVIKSVFENLKKVPDPGF
jgi:hypothetical protein